MRALLRKLAICLQLSLLILALQACRKSPTSSGGADATNVDGTGPTTEASNPVFNPKRTPLAEDPWSSTLENAYETAAGSALEFQNSMPYARVKILQNALPKIKETLALYKAEVQKNRKLANPALLIQADSRFAGIVFEPLYQKLLSEQKLNLMLEPIPLARERIADNATMTNTPQVGNVPAVSVSHFGPGSIPSGLAALGKGVKESFLSSQASASVKGECIQLVNEIDAGKKAPSDILAFHISDQLYVSAAKIGTKALYEDLLGKIVTYNGSLFVGTIQNGGELQIWQMKQPFAINIVIKDIDEKARLNTGIEVDADFGITVVGDEVLCRQYGNGMWSTWGNTPEVNSVHIVKTSGWMVERPPTKSFRSFITLSASQIDAALKNTDTTKLIGNAEGVYLKFQDATLSPRELALLIQSYSAREDSTNAIRCAQEFVKRQSDVADLKIVAGSLSELLCRMCPAAGLGFYNANLFDYYAPYKRKLGTDADVDASVIHKRGNEKHPYSRVALALVSSLIKTYERIVEAAPDDLDARFDLAMLCSLYSSQESDMLTAKETLTKAFENLRIVFTKAKGTSQASGRDFTKLLTKTPTFLPFEGSNDIDTQNEFEALLKIVGASSHDFWQRYVNASDYYREGY